MLSSFELQIAVCSTSEVDDDDDEEEDEVRAAAALFPTPWRIIKLQILPLLRLISFLKVRMCNSQSAVHEALSKSFSVMDPKVGLLHRFR